MGLHHDGDEDRQASLDYAPLPDSHYVQRALAQVNEIKY